MLRAALAVGAVAVSCGSCTPSSDASPTPAPRGSAVSAAPAPAPSATVSADAAAKSTAPLPPLRGGGERAVSSRRGLVVSVEENATRAGVSILERGGNAVDAAVATAYALAVTHPSAGNVGGGGFLLARMNGSDPVAIDFRETAPAALTREKFDAMIDAGARGPASSGVPGTVAGLGLAHERWGKLPLAEVLAPAVKLAREGHRVGRRQALTFGWSWRVLREDAEAKKAFGNRGKPPAAGARLVRADLAATLERIAKEGSAAFYRGPIAERIVRAMGKTGLIGLDDLAGYRAVVREPLRGTYRGFDVVVAPPPSSGGVAVLLTLAQLEKLEAFHEPPGSARELHLFVEAARRAQAARRFAIADPDRWEGAELDRRRRTWLDLAALLPGAPPVDRERATPSGEVHPLYANAMKELEHTTHFSVIDRDGNAVSCTTTLSAGFGAGYVVPGTGIVMNNSVAAFGTGGESQPAAGRRTTSSMAPTLVFARGELRLLLGSPGGDTIPSTVVHVLRNVVDHGMTIDRAVEAPRIHHGFVPDEVRYERARPVAKSVRAELEKMGHAFSKTTIAIGDANDVLVADGVAWGFADPREGGLALAARSPDEGR